MMMRKNLVWLGFLIVWTLTSSAVYAGDESKREVVSEEFGVRVAVPTGWVAGEPPKGALAVLRAATDEASQIEVRVSANVPAKQREAYYVSFHSSLRRAGFTLRETRGDVEYGSHKGTETEYEVRSKGQEYRLFVFQFHRNEEAWIVTGFFPAGRAEAHKRTLEEVVRGITF